MNDDILTEVGTLAMHLFETEIPAQDRTPWMELPENIKEGWRESARKRIAASNVPLQPLVTPEKVVHPSHYGGGDNPYETIKVLESWLTPEQFIGFCRGNAIKYQSRAGKKGGESAEQDLAKARWYLDREIAFRKKTQ